MPTVQERAQELETKRGEMKKLFDDNKNEKGELTLDAGKIKELNTREDELKTLHAEYVEAKRLDDLANANEKELGDLQAPANGLPFGSGHPKGGPEEPGTRPVKSLSDLFLGSKQYKSRSKRHVAPVEIEDVDMKTTMITGGNNGGPSTGYPPQVLRSGVIVPYAFPQPTLMDLVPQGTTNQNGYKYMLETVNSNNAAEVAEGALANEAALTFAEQLSPVVKISVFIPVTEEEMADVDGLRSIIDDRLTGMVKRRINAQMVAGNGTAPNLTGIINTPGVLAYAQQTTNAPKDNIVDAVYKGMVKVQTTSYADPTATWFNPLDWQNVRLMKNSFGGYIYGDPSQPGLTSVFGLPVATHIAVPQATAITGDWNNCSKLLYRNGIEISVSDSHADYFVRGQLAIRAQVRVAWVILRPAAFCEITGLTAEPAGT